MKAFLPLLLLVPLHSFAQFGRSYTGPTMQQNMQSRQDFNRMTNQRTQDFQRQQMERSQQRMWNSGRPLSKETRAQALAKQQQLELEATEKLARLAQEQQRRRQEHPAKNPQQAAAQLKADNKQLNRLAVKNFQEVFLPGQYLRALAAQQPAASTERSLRSLNENLLSDAWWSRQNGAQAANAVKAYGDSITQLTSSLLGFNLASPPAVPAPFSARSLDEQLLKDTFDQPAATQLVQDAALTERLLASEQLSQAVKDFAAMSSAVATDAALQGDPKKLRKEVQKGLRTVNKALAQYSARLDASNKTSSAVAALYKSTASYLAKSNK